MKCGDCIHCVKDGFLPKCEMKDFDPHVSPDDECDVRDCNGVTFFKSR